MWGLSSIFVAVVGAINGCRKTSFTLEGFHVGSFASYKPRYYRRLKENNFARFTDCPSPFFVGEATWAITSRSQVLHCHNGSIGRLQETKANYHLDFSFSNSPPLQGTITKHDAKKHD